MGRSNRRKKIARLLRQAKKRQEEEARKMEDPTTVAGQSICSIETLVNHERERDALKRMLQEEVVVDSEDDVTTDATTRSWLGAAWQYIFGT